MSILVFTAWHPFNWSLGQFLGKFVIKLKVRPPLGSITLSGHLLTAYLIRQHSDKGHSVCILKAHSPNVSPCLLLVKGSS
ncbi:CST complex subunit CTC1 [Clarias magur]|uniref:CST complex subunit CTC1 n=1 Tax=Clarias magur TaxID=1594786 RepID=A0A8J4WT73_CLAMG|nr:CST complex subunit CTC1 [Clarias magur]